MMINYLLLRGNNVCSLYNSRFLQFFKVCNLFLNYFDYKRTHYKCSPEEVRFSRNSEVHVFLVWVYVHQ